ncbi:MAG TPA: hypothetical protein VF937_16775, partial [Chloroflexota bacterium]
IRGAQLARDWQPRRVDLLIGLASVLVLGYVNKSAGWFPKYQVALAPLLACASAPLVVHLAHGRGIRLAAVALVAGLAAAAITLGLVRDDWALQRTWAIQTPAAAWLLALVVVGALVGFGYRGQAFAATASTTLVGLAIGWSLAIDGVQAAADYQTDYWYGTTGTVAAAAWVDSHLAPGQTFVAAKEVAIRGVDQRYVDQDDLVYLLGSGRGFDGTWAGEPLHAVVAWQREPYIADLFERGLPAAGFRAAERLGDYVIYVPVS